MKSKVWLVEQGHIATAGRGRPRKTSLKDGREISVILDEAVKSGVKFSDWPKSQANTSTGVAGTARSAGTTKTKSKPPKAGLPEYRFDYLYSEEDHVAVENAGKKRKRSMREACQNCRVSLVQCHCGDPTIVAEDGTRSVKVTIKRK